MIDEKKIEEAARANLDYWFSPNMETAFKDGFKLGINWFLDNIKHNHSEKPKAGEEVFIQLYEDGSWHSAIFNGYDFDIEDMNKENKYSVQLIEITRWLYIDDLLKGGK